MNYKIVVNDIFFDQNSRPCLLVRLDNSTQLCAYLHAWNNSISHSGPVLFGLRWADRDKRDPDPICINHLVYGIKLADDVSKQYIKEAISNIDVSELLEG